LRAFFSQFFSSVLGGIFCSYVDLAWLGLCYLESNYANSWFSPQTSKNRLTAPPSAAAPPTDLYINT